MTMLLASVHLSFWESTLIKVVLVLVAVPTATAIIVQTFLFKVMAQVYLRQGRTIDAVRVLNTCLIWLPADAEAMTQLAGLAETIGDHAQAARLRARIAFVAPRADSAALPSPPHS